MQWPWSGSCSHYIGPCCHMPAPAHAALVPAPAFVTCLLLLALHWPLLWPLSHACSCSHYIGPCCHMPAPAHTTLAHAVTCLLLHWPMLRPLSHACSCSHYIGPCFGLCHMPVSSCSLAHALAFVICLLAPLLALHWPLLWPLSQACSCSHYIGPCSGLSHMPSPAPTTLAHAVTCLLLPALHWPMLSHACSYIGPCSGLCHMPAPAHTALVPAPAFVTCLLLLALHWSMLWPLSHAC